MNAEILQDDVAAGFFAPAEIDALDALLAQYRAMHGRIMAIADVMDDSEHATTIGYFLEGNRGNEYRYIDADLAKSLFKPEGAIAALNSNYWERTLRMTDVLECLPQKRRDDWYESIRNHATPDFTEETVRATIAGLLGQRAGFMAEKIDGIFRGLSGKHVTNAPEAFGKRMILAGIINEYGMMNYSVAGRIHDLRQVIAKFMGRGIPVERSTYAIIHECNRVTGQWVSCDGGSLRIRTYKAGTAHIEVHPDMAWRLNLLLHSLYPAAIPPKFRQKPAREVKHFAELQRSLPFQVVNILLRSLEQAHKPDPQNIYIDYVDAEKGGAAYDQVCDVLAGIGGEKIDRHTFCFDYNPYDVLREIVITGCIPDEKSYQFYPTPEKLVDVVGELAQIEHGHSFLEPSAGRGALAGLAFFGESKNVFVELSALNCKVLESRFCGLGAEIVNADFLEWSKTCAQKFDRIVMNPPFADGRAKLHVEAAFSLLADGGRLVAILPASMKGKELFADAQCEWSQVYSNEFAGTGVSVAILTVTLPALAGSAK